MALNFPDNPGIGSVFTDTNSGFSYKWDGTVWNGFVGQQPSEIKVLTDISGSFDGSETTFALEYDGSAVHPVNAAQLRVVLGGVVQSAGSDYTISTSNIVFTTAPIAALDCTITLLGTALALNDPANESVTPAKLSTGGPSWNTSGDLYISGIATANNGLVVGVGLTLGDNIKLNLGDDDDLQIVHDGSNSIIDDAGTGSLILKSDTEIKFLKRTGDENIVVATPDGSVAAFFDNTKRVETTNGGALVYGTVGAGQTALIVEGDARVTGVVTVGEASITIDGVNDSITVPASGNVYLGDSATVNLGAGNDLQILHDGTNSIIRENGSGSLIIAGTGETTAVFTDDGSVELYYDNSKKLETTTSGVTVTGTVSATSFSGDGSALTGISAGTSKGLVYYFANS
jgi:hypothetical protein